MVFGHVKLRLHSADILQALGSQNLVLKVEVWADIAPLGVIVWRYI